MIKVGSKEYDKMFSRLMSEQEKLNQKKTMDYNRNRFVIDSLTGELISREDAVAIQSEIVERSGKCFVDSFYFNRKSVLEISELESKINDLGNMLVRLSDDLKHLSEKASIALIGI